MKDKQTKLAIILVIVTVLVVGMSFIFNMNKEETKTNEINIVTNYSNFYTVNSCLYRTITYLSANDKESVLLILNDEYKKQNNINKDNVLSVFPAISENFTFSSKKMYYQTLDNGIVKYYVYGSAMKDQILDGELITEIEETDLYFIVYIDTNGSIFSVEPYDGDIFIGGVNNEE